MVAYGGLDDTIFQTRELTAEDGLAEVGEHVGVAAAGSRRALGQIEAWRGLASDAAASGVAKLVAERLGDEAMDGGAVIGALLDLRQLLLKIQEAEGG